MKNLKIIFSFLMIIGGLSIPSFSQLLRHGLPMIVPYSDGEIYRERIQRFLVKADNLFRQGNYLEALNQLDLAVESSPQNPEVYLHRAILRYRLGMETEANQDIELVSRMNPVALNLFGLNGPKAQMDLLAFYPEDLYLALDLEDRLVAYEDILLDWYEAMSMEEDLDALPALETATNHLTRILEGIAQEDWEIVDKKLALLSSINKDASLVSDLKGLLALYRNDVGQAAAHFRTAIQLDPYNAMAWYNLGGTQRKNNLLDAAMESLNRAVRLQPTLTVAYFERALVYKELGELEAALGDYSSIIMLEGVAHLPSLLNRALTLKKLGKFTAALNDLDFLIQLAPTAATPYKVRGNIHLLSGAYNKAIWDFTKAIQQDDDFAEAYFNRAIAHLLNYNVQPACMDFEQSAERGYERGVEKQVYFCSN